MLGNTPPHPEYPCGHCLSAGAVGAVIEAEMQEGRGPVARVLNLGAPPRVYMISAKYADRYDLPQLRDMLGQQKSIEEVGHGKQAAVRQQGNSVLGWIQRQDLPQQAARLRRRIHAVLIAFLPRIRVSVGLASAMVAGASIALGSPGRSVHGRTSSPGRLPRARSGTARTSRRSADSSAARPQP